MSVMARYDEKGQLKYFERTKIFDDLDFCKFTFLVGLTSQPFYFDIAWMASKRRGKQSCLEMGGEREKERVQNTSDCCEAN